MATGEPTGLRPKAFALLDLPPKRRVGDRLAEWMARVTPVDADPGPSRLVKFRQVCRPLIHGYRPVRLRRTGVDCIPQKR